MDITEKLKQVENVVTSKDFERWRKEFVDENCHHFTYDEEENKLIYTTIYNEYVAKIEKRIEEEVPDLDELMKVLPHHMEIMNKRGNSDNDAGKTVIFLLEMSDFHQFVQMMQYVNGEKKSKSKDTKDSNENKSTADDKTIQQSTVTSDVLASLDLDTMMVTCAQLSEANSADKDWINLYTTDWISVDKKSVEPEKRKSANEIYMRSKWVANMNVIQSVDMFMSVDERRHRWDTNFKRASFPYGGNPTDDEVVETIEMDHGYLMNLVMFGGKKMTLHVKVVKQWDTPTAGSVTFAIIPWKLESNQPDLNHSILSLKIVTISPHPLDPCKSVCTTLEKNYFGVLPTWAMHWMIRGGVPTMLKGMENRYVSYIKSEHGKVVDMTKFNDDCNIAESKMSELKIDSEDNKGFKGDASYGNRREEKLQEYKDDCK